MKHKISDILEGMPSKDTSYAAVARGMPDIIMRRDKAKATMGKEATSLETHLATSIRASSLSYLLFNAERAARQGGGYEEGEEGDEEEEQDGEIETPVHIESGLLDPRLTEAGVEFERLEVRNRHDTGEEEDDDGEIEMAVDGGAGAIDPRLTEAVEELEKLVGPNENEIDDRMEVDGVEEE